MKGSRWYLIIILAFLVVMFAVEYQLPKKFVWTPTFSQYDHQPFGCAVFDSLLSSSLPSGYELSKKTFYQLEKEDTMLRRGILVVAKDLLMIQADVEAILKMAERGNKIMLVSTLFSKSLEDTLQVRCDYSSFSPMALKKHATALHSKDSLCWVGDSAVYPRQTFYFYSQFCSSTFGYEGGLKMNKVLAHQFIEVHTPSNDSIDTDSSSVRSISHPPVAVTRSWGKGEIILVSTPLLFTNYGMLDGANSTYVFRILSQMGELPIVRTEGYTKNTAQEEQSPFRYLLSQPPLRWALCLTMITIVLFLIFTARRRQRAIPVVRQSENRSLEFTELIGTLYYQKKDHADLVRKKFAYLTETLRREIQVDVDEIANDEYTFRRMAQKTGMEVDEIERFIRTIRPVLYGSRTVTDVEMKQFIDKINEIINHI